MSKTTKNQRDQKFDLQTTTSKEEKYTANLSPHGNEIK